MKSIEPIVYPDGLPRDDDDEDEQEEIFGEEEEFEDSYEMEVASIPEKEDKADVPTDTGDAASEGNGEETYDPLVPQEEQIIETDGDTEVLDSFPEKGDDTPDTGEWDNVVEEPAPEDVEEPVEIDLGSMSQEEIEALLSEAGNVSEEKTPVSSEDEADILSMFGDDEDISEIKETLEKADNNIAVDKSALEEPEIELPNVDDEDGESGSEDGETQKPKKEKKKKNKKGKEAGDGEKKTGLFARIIAALTEEDEEEKETNIVPEQAETGVTDENAKILSELDSEEDVKRKKKKKKKKDKKGKEDKEQPETEGDERDIRKKPEDDEENPENDSKKDKKRKAKKEKKPKKEKPEEGNEKPPKKLPKKRVRNTIILCLSILAAIVILSYFMNEHLNRKQARFAFENQQYEEAYVDLYGEELKGDDLDIYNKSYTIMLLRRKVDSYDNYMLLGMKAEALNALLEGQKMYPDVLKKAEEYGVTDQVNESYALIIEGLYDFGITEEQAAEINSYTSKVLYNKKIREIADGQGFRPEGDQDPEDAEGNAGDIGDTDAEEDSGEEGPMTDILPEEMDFLPEDPNSIF
ncbi:MAG: hypothetical protein K6G69_06855 [Lachnospiraceae bacterium]|nr:hypothetical protein [Lachnospiraceae bacterium]